MKKISKIKYHLILASALILAFASCKKDTKNGVLVGSNGTPTISSVRTISKSTIDSSRTSTYHYYKSNGTDSVVVQQNLNPVVTAFDSTTTTGKIGNYYAAIGTHLGSVTKITLNGINVIFNRALASDNSVIFSIPSNTPYVQPQSNTLVITTLYGSVTYSFTTLPPAPSVTSASDYNFTSGTQISLKGTGLSFVTAIKLQNTTDAVTIVSKTDTSMIVKMPSSTVSRAVLSFTYTSGTNSLHTASTLEFINIDKAYQIFANGALQNAWTTNSWASPSGPSANAPSKSGLGSFVATYPAGGWQIEGFANYYPSFTYDISYKYLTFWVKGGVADHTLVLVGDKMKGGDNQVQNANAYAAQLIKAPKNVWTYYKIPLTNAATVSTTTSLNFWETGKTATTLRFFLQGMSGDVNETLYFDEVMFVK
ncbi:hypothetical protein [Mucilaginibacter arboris]|uniref:IPT/TIG domain-containing protein n=1 Tax=Mucilaginibacter arboris TaxID=2682090 RepID=A0A7K1SZQ7_9SPHI|nr:hypothetical protein [Mucilaginibacter arboris]MVN22748.1 hypothetical protein [Mucilaginibacter arboris]